MRIRPTFTFVLWLVLWISQWWLLPQYYVRTQELGWYPPEADSIGIPIMGAWMLIIVGSIFLSPFIYSVCRFPRPQFLTWTAWSAETPVRGVLWTLVFGYLAIDSVFSVFTSLSIGLPLKALSDLCWIYVHLSLRAIFIAGLKTKVADQSDRDEWMQGAPTHRE